MVEVISFPHAEWREINSFAIRAILGAANFQELLAAFTSLENDLVGQESLAQTSSHSRLFLTLEDPGQASYTAGHATNHFDLDKGISYPSEDTPTATILYEREVGSSAQAALVDPDRLVSWSQMQASLMTLPEDVEGLCVLNANPDLLLEEIHYALNVPAGVCSDELLMLSAMPNGYFECDWNPFQNAAVIRRFTEHHGYRLIGMGAATLCFLRNSQHEVEAGSVIADLQHLYGQSDSRAWEKLRIQIETSNVLILGYTEGFAPPTD